MRVLLVPEVYRPADATSSGTVRDAVAWVDYWLDADESLHVYWLLPPRERANYERSDVLADRERATLIEAEPFMAGREERDLFTEGGYGEAELRALRRSIHDEGAYVDAVVDQRRTGRTTLYKWLLAETDHWAADVRPFDVIANVHDLQSPFKYRYCEYRNRYQSVHELFGATFADGLWITAGVDAAALAERADALFRRAAVAPALSRAEIVASPIEFDRYESTFADQPRRFHVAGGLWEKRRADAVFEIGRRLHREHGVETILTSTDPIPERYRRPSWVEAHPDADRETYESALEAGDLTVCASAYETMPRTPFEQVAAGQVLVARDEPWLYDSAPADYALAGDVDDLGDLAAAAVERWDDAVAETRRLLDHCRAIRHPDRVGGRTYRDLRRRVDAKRRRYEGGETAALVADALDAGDRPDDGVDPNRLLDRARERAADERRWEGVGDVAPTDVRHALRALGYRDDGGPGRPTFRPADAD